MAADVYRGIFKFGVFNAVQSQCYDTVSSGLLYVYLSLYAPLKVMHTDENMVRDDLLVRFLRARLTW